MPYTKNKFYKLSKLQVAILRKAASGETTLFAVLTPNKDIDSPDALKRLKQEEKILLDFITLGLCSDVSKDFAEPIAKCKIDTKRAYRVLALTTAGKLMFDYCDDPDCESHPKGDPHKRLPC
jgi:hypothetical protein